MSKGAIHLHLTENGEFLSSVVKTESQNGNREEFSSKFGFVMSCIGAALSLTGEIVTKIFQEMSYGGIISIVFFLSVIFATIASSINILEGPVEALLSATKLSRVKASIIISPIGSLIVAICFFFLTSKETILNDINRNVKYKIGDWFIFFRKYIFTTITILIVILGVIYGGIG